MIRAPGLSVVFSKGNQLKIKLTNPNCPKVGNGPKLLVFEVRLVIGGGDYFFLAAYLPLALTSLNMTKYLDSTSRIEAELGRPTLQ